MRVGTSTQFYVTEMAIHWNGVGETWRGRKRLASARLEGQAWEGNGCFWICYHLLSGPKRFGELQRLLPQASRQMITIQLRQLEQVGMIHRRVYDVTPPKVEYQLSDLGKTAEPILRQLYAWGQWYHAQVGQEIDWLVSLGSKWKIWIWYHLLTGPRRFGELQDLLPQISRRILTLELRELEQMSIVQRQACVQEPARQEYALTPLGQNSEPVLRQLYASGRWTCEQFGLVYDWPVSDETAGNVGEAETGGWSISRGGRHTFELRSGFQSKPAEQTGQRDTYSASDKNERDRHKAPKQASKANRDKAGAEQRCFNDGLHPSHHRRRGCLEQQWSKAHFHSAIGKREKEEQDQRHDIPDLERVQDIAKPQQEDTSRQHSLRRDFCRQDACQDRPNECPQPAHCCQWSVETGTGMQPLAHKDDI